MNVNVGGRVNLNMRAPRSSGTGFAVKRQARRRLVTGEILPDTVTAGEFSAIGSAHGKKNNLTGVSDAPGRSLS